MRHFAFPAVGIEECARLGDVERIIALEAPGVEADRDVVGEHVVAGKGEIDDAGEPLAEKENIVRKQIGVNHAIWQIHRPNAAFEMIELSRDELAQTVLQFVGARSCCIEQRTPAGNRQRIGTRHRKIASGDMHSRQRLADTGAVRDIRLARPDALQKSDDRCGPAGQDAQHLAASVLDRQRTDDAARCEMRHQPKKERQVAFGDALFIQGQDEIARSGMQQEIGILDALGDALVGQ